MVTERVYNVAVRSVRRRRRTGYHRLPPHPPATKSQPVTRMPSITFGRRRRRLRFRFRFGRRFRFDHFVVAVRVAVGQVTRHRLALRGRAAVLGLVVLGLGVIALALRTHTKPLADLCTAVRRGGRRPNAAVTGVEDRIQNIRRPRATKKMPSYTGVCVSIGKERFAFEESRNNVGRDEYRQIGGGFEHWAKKDA